MNFQLSKNCIHSIRDLHHSKNNEIQKQNRRIGDGTSDTSEHNRFEHVDASLKIRRKISERKIKGCVNSKITKQICNKAPKVLKELDGK